MNQNQGTNQMPNQTPNQMPNQMPNQTPNQMPNQAYQQRAQGTQANNAGQFIAQNNNQQQPKKKKKGLSKELVTIIGVILIVGILYFTYNYQLNKNLEITRNIPVAVRTIPAGSKITDEDIKTIDVPASTLNSLNAITSSSDIVGKYVLYDTIIPEGSLFYSSTLSEEDISPDAMFENLSESEDAIMIDVDLEKTYGNSIMPGNVIDIYAEAITTNNKGETEYIVGPLVTGAKVLAVLDSAGNNVFADHNNTLYPSWFVFTLPSNIIETIRKAKKMQESENQIQLFPVVSGKTWKTEGDNTIVSQSVITDLIEKATIEVKGD